MKVTVEAKRDFIIARKFRSVTKGQKRIVQVNEQGMFLTTTDDGELFGSCTLGDGWDVIKWHRNLLVPSLVSLALCLVVFLINPVFDAIQAIMYVVAIFGVFMMYEGIWRIRIKNIKNRAMMKRMSENHSSSKTKQTISNAIVTFGEDGMKMQ